jgi:uncharacterized membrane protein YdjX (TVP38/TMEM64 family)
LRVILGPARGVISALRSILAAPGRLFVAGALIGLTLVGVVGGQVWPGAAVALVHSMVEFLRREGVAGPALFAALQVLVALSGALPASLLGVAAGAVYGLVPGFSLAALGSLLGALIAFGLSRSLFRSAIERLVSRHRRLRSLDALVSKDGWKVVCLLRLSPVMPFSATSYLLGLSAVSLPNYLVGTLASLPALLGYVFLGTLTDSGLSAWAGGANPLRWILLGVGGIATLLIMAHLGRLVLQREVAPQLVNHDCGSGA